MDNNILWYNRISPDWNSALPLGNGFMGAMCFGGNVVDRFQLNCGTLWRGGFRDRINPDAKENIPKIRQLIAKGKINEAQNLANLAMAGVPDYQCHYEPLCDLYIIPESGENTMIFGLREGWGEQIYRMHDCENYRRQLDIDSGIHTTSYIINGKNHIRESFISYPDNVMCIHSEGSPVSVHAERGIYMQSLKRISENTVCMSGLAGSDGVEYVMCIRAIEGGIDIIGRTVRCAESCTVVIAAETSFDCGDPLDEVIRRLDNAEKLGYRQLKERHISEFTGIMNRCKLKIDCKDNSDIPTDERLAKAKNGETDIGLVNLSFAYGRYLLVSSSREGGVPANLQGIWNDSFTPVSLLFTTIYDILDL